MFLEAHAALIFRIKVCTMGEFLSAYIQDHISKNNGGGVDERGLVVPIGFWCSLLETRYYI
jgi:hypothetical protein